MTRPSRSLMSLALMLAVACGGGPEQSPYTTADSGVGGVLSGGTAGTGSTGGLASGATTGGATTGGATTGGGGFAGTTGGGTTGGGMTGGGGTTGGGTTGGATTGGGTTGGATTGGATTGGGTTAGGTPGGGFIRGPAPSADALTKDGPYKVMSTTSGFRDGPNFAEATLWWPTDAEPPFASVAVVPGWVSTENDIKTWGPYLASYGIVVLTIGTNSPASDLPDARAAALLDALMTIRAENTRAGGPLNGKLDTTRQATMGWSMGGGGTLLAGAQTPSLKAVISMCGWNPGYNYSKVTVPALLFASKGDPLAGGQSQGFYDTIPMTTPKMLWEIDGGDHYFFNTPKNHNGVVGRYGLSWLKVFLEGDERYKQFLVMPASKTDFKTNVTQ
jgi:dienelactone hydrolase